MVELSGDDDKIAEHQKHIPPLEGNHLRALVDKLGNGWQAVQERHLEKEFEFFSEERAKKFSEDLKLISSPVHNHVDTLVFGNKVKVVLFDKEKNGITPNDIELAVLIDSLSK